MGAWCEFAVYGIESLDEFTAVVGVDDPSELDEDPEREWDEERLEAIAFVHMACSGETSMPPGLKRIARTLGLKWTHRLAIDGAELAVLDAKPCRKAISKLSEPERLEALFGAHSLEDLDGGGSAMDGSVLDHALVQTVVTLRQIADRRGVMVCVARTG